MNIRDELSAKLQEMGVKDIKPFWNSEWLDRVWAMPDGIEKEREKEKALQSVMLVLTSYDHGEYEVVDFIDEDLTT